MNRFQCIEYLRLSPESGQTKFSCTMTSEWWNEEHQSSLKSLNEVDFSLESGSFQFSESIQGKQSTV